MTEQPLPPLSSPSPRPDTGGTGFLPHVHRLRGLAMILVVGAHCWPGFAWTELDRRGLALAFDNVTVIFMFVSGLLFRHLLPRFAYPRYLRHRAATVLLPYAIVSIPAIAAAIWLVHRPDVAPWVYAMPAWRQAAYFLLTGKHLAPLWFMPMIALFILAAPAFALVDRRNLYPWLLPVTVVLATLLGRDSVAGAGSVLGKALFMLPAYLAGMAYARHRPAVERWTGRHWPWLAAAFAAASLMMLTGTTAIDAALVQKTLLAMLLLVVLARVTFPAAVDRGLSLVAERAFAVYFIHGYVITTFRLAYAHATGLSPQQLATGVLFPRTVVGLLADIALVLLVTLAVIAVVRRLLGRRSRYLIGA